MLAERADTADLTLGLSVVGTPSQRLQVGSGSRQLSLALRPSQLASLFYNGEALPRLLETDTLKVRPASSDSAELLGLLFPPTDAGRFPMDGY